MKNKVFSILFILFLFGFMFLAIFLPDQEISTSERRKLASFPDIKLNAVFSGEFFEDINQYFVEQFPLRMVFRNIKGSVAKNIFGKKLENEIFIKDQAIYQLNPNINEKPVKHFTNLVKKIKLTSIKTNHIYYSMIPDKNYYIDHIPKLNYESLEQLLKQELSDMVYIDIKGTLNLDSYYKTDIHWRQEKLEPVVLQIEKKMNLPMTAFPKTVKTYDSFYGALYGRIANRLQPDQLVYLTDDEINEARVFDYEKQRIRKVYEENDLLNIDSYDIYLGGAKALLMIENKNQKNNKELILFRDSFGSSIAPLLISNYSKITMIDLRYISSDVLDQVNINWNEDQDVLFLYSVPIINNSFTLK